MSRARDRHEPLCWFPAPAAAVRDRPADAVAIVLAPLYGDATRPGAAIPWPVDLAVGVAGTAVLPARRGHPVAVLVALLPAGAISVTATGPVMAALFTAAIRLPFRLVLLLGTVNVSRLLTRLGLNNRVQIALLVHDAEPL